MDKSLELKQALIDLCKNSIQHHRGHLAIKQPLNFVNKQLNLLIWDLNLDWTMDYELWNTIEPAATLNIVNLDLTSKILRKPTITNCEPRKINKG